MERTHSLTAEEARVLLQKGTERPFTGEFEEHFSEGVYLCRQCDFPLFLSKDKFSSGCGWPSFDECFEVNIEHRADGDREEVVCGRCKGHLGHLFRGEGFTKKNLRFCINSVSLAFNPSEEKGHKVAYFAAGCFWSVEYYFSEAPGVISAISGYMNGVGVSPTYEEVCSNQYGFAEAVKVIYDPGKTTFEALVDLFFSIHNPRQKDRQGVDVGRQYRSAIFYLTEGQKEIALKKKEAIPGAVTEIVTASRFYPAEDYHQQYCKKMGQTPHCSL